MTPKRPPPSTGSRLHVVAGFPTRSESAIRTALSKRFDKTGSSFVSVSSANSGYAIYSDNTVLALLKAAGGFAIDRRYPDWKPMAPGRLILFYCPANDVDRLLSAFRLSAHCIRLDDDFGAQSARRFDVKAAVDAIASIADTLAQEGQPPLSLSRTDIRRLPPLNFHIDRENRLKSKFLEAINGQISWAELDGEIRPKKFTNSQLPEALKDCPRKYLYEDARGVVFPPDNSDHGNSWMVSDSTSIKGVKNLLNGLFRFGTAVESGFHYDAQRVGESLKKDHFQCCDKGKVVLSSSHANIYLNEHVRPGD